MAAEPPIVTPADILNAIDGAGVTVSRAAPPPIPPTVTTTTVSATLPSNAVNLGEYTAKERARDAVSLAYFVGSLILLVIVMVFVDYLARMPSTPDNLAGNQPTQPASPTPETSSPQATPPSRATPTAQQTSFVQEAAFLQPPTGQATPGGQGTPKTNPSTVPGRTASPESTPAVQLVAAPPKTPAENYVFISNAIADRSVKMFDLMVTRALLPVLTALLGYIFGSQPSRNNT